MYRRLSVIEVIGLVLLLLSDITPRAHGQALASQFASVLRIDDSNDHHRVKRYPVEAARVISTACPTRCYRRLVRGVGPVDIKGLVEIQIQAPPRGVKPLYNYTNTWEAFERTCWAYRKFTMRCLSDCEVSSDKAWFQDVFFSILHNYCVEDYDGLVSYWSCYQKLAERGGACEKMCSTSCSVDCSTNCNRPLAIELCGTDRPLDVLNRVVKRVLPKIVNNIMATGQRLECEEEISLFLRAK
uniref:Uncharacterized protein n=1 Tax=Plectus sambesii TaxID=2011161 RepID=A0A914V0M3_9BILA